MTISHTDAEWWKQAAVYQIYPRSFADGNGDGIGDLKGIINRVSYLKDLGIDAVWMSPFYPSPLKDGGYDVADFRNVDPRIGTVEEFEEMVVKLKDVGIKVIIDLVPNHASEDHAWFQAALKAPSGSTERARFHFMKGRGPGGQEPPSDWQSPFGGPSWTRVSPESDEWYLHIYDKSQPDFNWSSPDIVADFEKTLRFWGDRGVAGFRVDVAAGCAKDLSAEQLDRKWEMLKDWRLDMSRHGGERHDHPLFDRDEVFDIYKGWRKVLNEYDPPLMAIAEAFVSPERKRLYAASETLGQIFSFDMLFCDFDAKVYKRVIERQLKLSKEYKTGSTWVLSSHDVIRHADRYGLPPHGVGNMQPFLLHYREWLYTKGKSMQLDRARGLRRARAASLMMMALPGSCYLYQGEELGLPEVLDIPADQRQDPRFHNTNGQDIGRDGCRVPLPWSDSKEGNFGFSSTASASDAHLPQPDSWGQHSVELQDGDQQSTLAMYRRALALRKNLLADGSLEWVESQEQVIAFERPGGWKVILNAGQEPIPLPSHKQVMVASCTLEGDSLPGEAAVWLRV